MIKKILKPKTDQEIMRAIVQNPCPAERFVLGFCFYFEKNPYVKKIPELIENLKNPLVKITINVNRENPGPDLSPIGFKLYKPPIIEYEIIAETSFSDDGLSIYKRKMLIVRNNYCYIMP